jgi:transposase InsO family protein
MPWQETSAMDERLRFVRDYSKQERSLAGLCREYRISRKTGYKWISRYEAAGSAGLTDQVRAARLRPHAVAAEVAEWILHGRTVHPSWGPKKLVAWVRRESGLKKVCAVSTAGEILKRAGLSVARQSTRKGEAYAGVLVEGRVPNELWCVDFKGAFRLGDRSRCEPLTLTDGCSRYLLKCQCLPNTGLAETRRVFERAFREYGLPERIRSDNGAPFGSIGLGGLSALSVWWLKLAIRPERIAPGQPYQNGRHERMHLTLKQETTNPPAPSLRGQQRRFEAFRREFNEERPHEALGQQTPASVYRKSPREYPGRVKGPVYDEGVRTRRVQSNGMINWANQRIFMGEAFATEHIGFIEAGEGLWELRFGEVPIGLFDERAARIGPLPGRRRGRRG